MEKTDIQPHKSSLGMDANIVSLVIFTAMAVLSWIPYLQWVSWGVPLAFLLFLEKESKFVKSQSVTALVYGIIWTVIMLVLRIFFRIITPTTTAALLRYALEGGSNLWMYQIEIMNVVRAVFTLFAGYLAFMAFCYKQVKVPLISSIAAKSEEKLKNVTFNQTSGFQTSDTVCQGCGGKNPSGTKFCGSCGKAL